jgi:HEAT repeat protein
MKYMSILVAGVLTLPVAAAAQVAPAPSGPSAAPAVPLVATPRAADAAPGRRDVEEEVRRVQERVREEQLRTRDTLDEVRILQGGAGKVTTLTGTPFGSSDYDRGLSSLQNRQYDRAIESFDRVIAGKATRADGALYWKAYAQGRLARTEDALATLAALRRDFPQSRYLADGRILEADVRTRAGQPVDQQAMDANDEIKLYAISGIANTDPERAIPLLEGVLSGSNSLQLKKRAIYVLALSADARAHQVLLRYAKGAGTPDLQTEAIRYLASRRDSKTTGGELKDIYQSSQDKDVRRAVIDAYRASGNWIPLNLNVEAIAAGVNAVRTTQPRPGTASTAARSADADELWALYQEEPDADLRIQMTNVLMAMGAIDRVSQIAKTDRDTNVRQRAVRSLGGQRADRTGQALADIYNTQQDKDVRKAVISMLGNQNNAEGLVAIARKETDLSLKTEIVRRLSDLASRNKVAADYLMEVIK